MEERRVCNHRCHFYQPPRENPRAFVREMPFNVDISKLQNRCYNYRQTLLEERSKIGESDWVAQFRNLAESLHLQVPTLGETEVDA